MKANVINECADNPRACRGIIRAIRFTLPFFMCVSLAFAPFSAKLTNSGFCVEKSDAYAAAPVFAGAASFLEATAAAAGLSTSEFVATIAGSTAVALGMGIGTEQGISMGGSLSNNLEALVDAADYPAWDTLSASEQENWVTRDNYDSAKLNSLLAGYGLGDAYDRYQNTWGTSDDFGFTSSESNKLEQIGQVGTNWINGIGNQVQDIRTLISNAGNITQWASGNIYDYTKTDADVNWPASMPTTASYESTSQLQIGYTGNNTNYTDVETSNSVYCIATYNTIRQQGSYYYLPTKYILFSSSSFTYKLASEQKWTNCSTFVNEGNTLYYVAGGTSMNVPQNAQVRSNVVVNGPVDTTNAEMKWVAYYALFGGGSSTQDYQRIVDYPEDDIKSGQYDVIEVYYPEEGITPDTTWDDLTTEPEEPVTPVVRPDNPYNPNNQTGSQEWRDDTTSNVMPLQNIRFDKLFPFCLMTDVKNLTIKINETVSPGQQENYQRINIPVAYASDGQGGVSEENIELDGKPVYDLLVMIRPFNQVLLVFLLLMSVVLFWKSILTGD